MISIFGGVCLNKEMNQINNVLLVDYCELEMETGRLFPSRPVEGLGPARPVGTLQKENLVTSIIYGYNNKSTKDIITLLNILTLLNYIT